MNRADVVLVDWYYTDLGGSKLRPAVVVQADFLNGLIDDTILVQTPARPARTGRDRGRNRPSHPPSVAPGPRPAPRPGTTFAPTARIAPGCSA